MTAIANLPDIRPSLLLDFANSGRVDPRIQCTRASSATCFGPDGKLRTVAANVPRIDYDPVTGKCLGLLVEESRTNLVYPSVIPSGKGVVFGKVQLNGNTTAVSGIPSPDGSNNAVSITGASNSTNSSGMDNLRLLGVIPLENVGYSVSFYLKSAVTVTVREASSGTNVSFAPSSKWTRVSAVFTPTSPNQNIIITSAGGAEFSLFGLQVEVGSFPTSYIPTGGSAVTRVADVLTIPNLSAWFGNTEGTILAFADAIAPPAGSIGICSFNDGTSNNRLDIRAQTKTIRAGWGLASTAGSISSGIVMNGANKVAFGYKNNDFAASFNGSAALVNTTTLVPTVSRFLIGALDAGVAQLNGRIGRLVYFPKRLSNTQLQRLTA